MTAVISDRIVVGRKSVHDRDLEVTGYELVFRTFDGSGETAAGLPEEALTCEDIFSANGIGMSQLVGAKRVYCLADRSVLVGNVPLALPAHSVIEIEAGTTIDDEVLDGCRRLVGRGYQIALDGFRWFEGAGAILEIASIVKLDVHRTPMDEIGATMDRCRPFDVTFMADNVETQEELEALRRMHFSLFQGHALQLATGAIGSAAGAGSISNLRKAAGVLGEMLDFDDIEEILRPEPLLTLQIMQLASLGKFGETRRRIGSVREALVAVGSWRVQNWIAMLYANPTSGQIDERVFGSLMRAAACETLARTCADRSARRIAFAAGMLSSFQELLTVSGDELAKLALSPELEAAAFGCETPMAKIVCDVADYQSGTQTPRMISGATRGELDAAFAAAFLWAIEATAALAG